MTSICHFKQIRDHDIPRDVFLDANFVISFAIEPPRSQKKEYILHLNAKKLMTKLVNEEVNIYISLIILSEVWFALTRNLYESTHGKDTWKYVENKGSIFHQFLPELRSYTRKLFKEIPELKFIPSKDQKKIVENALDNIENYSLYPNDALHISTAQSEKILCVITNDKHFNQVGSLKMIINF